MKRITLAFAALLGLSAAAVHAEQPWTEIEDRDVMVESLGRSVGELTGASVFDMTGERIGEIDDILMNPEDNSMAASIDVGGFLGLGEKDVVLPLESLTNGSDDGVTVDMSEEELEALPEYEG